MTGEKQIFKQVWERQNGRCFITGEYIPYNQVQAWNFMHILPKAQNKFPQLKTNNLNIVMVVYDFHNDYDKGTKADLNKYPQERVKLLESVKSYLISLFDIMYNNGS